MELDNLVEAIEYLKDEGIMSKVQWRGYFTSAETACAKIVYKGGAPTLLPPDQPHKGSPPCITSLAPNYFTVHILTDANHFNLCRNEARARGVKLWNNGECTYAEYDPTHA